MRIPSEEPPPEHSALGGSAAAPLLEESERARFALDRERSRHQRSEKWLDTTFGIRLRAVKLLALLGYAFIGLGALLAIYIIALVVVHYTIPQLEWLEPDRLRKLEGFYSTLATVGVPFVLISNAWLIWWFSRPRSPVFERP